MLSNVEDRTSQTLANILRMRDDISAKASEAIVNISVQGQQNIPQAQKQVEDLQKSVASSSANTNGILSKTMGIFGQLGGAAKEAGSSAVGAMGAVQTAIKDTGGAITDMIGSLSMMAAGGAVAGLSYLGAAQEKLYEQQLMDSMAS